MATMEHLDWNVYKLTRGQITSAIQYIVNGKDVYVCRASTWFNKQMTIERYTDCLWYEGEYDDVLRIDGSLYMSPSALRRRQDVVVGLAPILCFDLVVKVMGFLYHI
jgi:hypothetical protein